MGNFSKFCANTENLAVVIAFDPGETTGWCAMGIPPDDLRWPGPSHRTLPREWMALIEYGQIDSRQVGAPEWDDAVRKHAGLNLAGENKAVERMLDIVDVWPRAVIVFEDFILDFTKADQARHTLSPVRITSAFTYGRYERGWMGTDNGGIHIQNRSLAKTTCTDLRLKNWGLYDTHSGPHARDATRHCFYFLRDCRGNGMQAKEKRHLAWPHLFDDPVSVNNTSAQKQKRPVGERVPHLG